jgi:Tfp pilus assembly PilM family ATPase
MQVSLEEARQMRKLAGSGDAEGGEEILRLVAEPTDALSQELTRCLRYYESVFPNRPVERVVFLGGQAYNKRLCQALARKLSIPAQIGDPLANIQREAGAAPRSDADDGEGFPEWAVAVGLSLGVAAQNRSVMRREEAVQL